MVSVTEVINRSKSSQEFTSLRFPSDLGPNAIMFNFKSYTYDGTLNSTVRGAKTTASIVLPLPSNLTDTYSIQVGPAQLGSTGAGVLDVVNRVGEEGLSGALQSGMNLAQDMGERAANLVTGSGTMNDLFGAGAAIKYFARSAVDNVFPGAGLALDVATGTAINPHATLNFDGVNLKEYTFNWSLAPKNSADSTRLVNIVNKFKDHFLPEYEDILGFGGSSGSFGRALLKYPDLVEISLLGVDEDYYFSFTKPGMISDFVTNYTPQGQAILKGGRPAFIDMSITFKEASIRTRQNYR